MENTTDTNEGITTDTNNEGTTTEETTTDTNTERNTPDTTVKETTPAETRYQISRERKMRKKIENELNEYKEKMKNQTPKFDDENDPDWINEIKYNAREEAKQVYEEMIKKSWLNEKLEKIENDKYINDTYHSVNTTVVDKFWKFGINLSKKEMQETMQQIDESGFTSLQIAMLSKADEIMEKMKPWTFTPWIWNKIDNAWDKTMTQEEINANIYKKYWTFWY